MSPSYRRGRACVFWWSLGLCGRATHAWQVQVVIPDQAGHGGLRRARTVEVRFRGRVCSLDAPVQANQWVRNSRRGSHLFKKMLSWSQQHRYRNRSNEIPWTWHQGPPLTFSSPWVGFVILMIFWAVPIKKVRTISARAAITFQTSTTSLASGNRRNRRDF